MNIEATKSMNLPQLTNLIGLIKRIADAINENEFKTRKIESRVFKWDFVLGTKTLISFLIDDFITKRSDKADSQTIY